MASNKKNLYDREHGQVLERHDLAALRGVITPLVWESGALMLSAPGWAVHNHASGPEPVYELTIQDSPLHLAMDSLMWQEDLEVDPVLLGSHRGFATNRETVAS